MRKYILFIVIGFVLSTRSLGQINNTGHTLSLKVGAAKTFAAPFGIAEGYAYRNYSKIYPYPVLGLEFSNRPTTKQDEKKIGIYFQPMFYLGGFNEKHIQSTSISRQLSIALYNLQVYGSIEKKLNKKRYPVSTDYFTWIAGIGLNINGPFGKKGSYYISSNDFAVTNNGKTITGSQLYFKDAQFFIAPSFFTGFRYHIRNKSGKESLTLELITNYGITRYFNYAVQYKIDGIPAEDKLGEKGFNIQLNAIIPIKTFRKKKSIHY